MKIQDCYEKRLLQKIKPDNEKVKRSLENAAEKLEKAKLLFEKDLFDACIIYGYTSMFHSARSLLYRDGIQEKSHVCIVLYLRENYRDTLPPYLIQSLDSFRRERHETLYGLDFTVTKKDAQLSITDAGQFLKTVKKLLR